MILSVGEFTHTHILTHTHTHSDTHSHVHVRLLSLVLEGMPNTSGCDERPMLQFLYHVPTYKEVRNYGEEALFA